MLTGVRSSDRLRGWILTVADLEDRGGSGGGGIPPEAVDDAGMMRSAG
jgi:hypothetical protein